MVEAVFGALAHAARREVLVAVWSGGGVMSAGDIAGRFSHAWPTTSRHLRVLAAAGLLAHERRGRTRIYRVNLERLEVARAWLRGFEAPPARAGVTRKEREMPGVSNISRAETALRDIAMTYPEATEHFPWGERAIKVKGKVFLFMFANAETLSLSTKLPASHEVALLLPFARPTGYGLGKSGWVTAKFDAHDVPPIDMLRAWVDESYRAVAPKTLAALVGGGATQKRGQAGKKTTKAAAKVMGRKVGKTSAKAGKTTAKVGKTTAKVAGKKTAKVATKKAAKVTARAVGKKTAKVAAKKSAKAR